MTTTLPDPDPTLLPGPYYLGPYCGACGGELEDVDPEGGRCERCHLYYLLDGFDSGAPEYDDGYEDTPPCGHHPDPCTTQPHEEFPNLRPAHAPCPLPTGHTSDHYDACTYKPVEA